MDLTNSVADRAEIERVNPHRHEFRLLDGVVLVDLERRLCAGYHDVRPDAFWVRGHIPDRPLFPGVLMIEAAAQLASYFYHRAVPGRGFLGFVAVDRVKFRGTVQPPCRFVIVGHGTEVKPRRLICELQGFIDSTMVFEAEITGMSV
ncbi:MAG: beta-hydroxyacyl-ACP dehydratase [Planctomycetes bacterium]|nr:beta-hydroxyacyl-ACP dehydratase [Planctomycetota bacterium]